MPPSAGAWLRLGLQRGPRTVAGGDPCLACPGRLPPRARSPWAYWGAGQSWQGRAIPAQPLPRPPCCSPSRPGQGQRSRPLPAGLESRQIPCGRGYARNASPASKSRAAAHAGSTAPAPPEQGERVCQSPSLAPGRCQDPCAQARLQPVAKSCSPGAPAGKDRSSAHTLGRGKGAGGWLGRLSATPTPGQQPSLTFLPREQLQ